MVKAASDLGGRYWDRTSDFLGVNEWQGGLFRSLTQFKGLPRSDEVNVGRPGCCIFLLYFRLPVDALVSGWPTCVMRLP